MTVETITTVQAEHVLKALRAVIRVDVAAEVRRELPKHVQADLDFLALVRMLEKRIKLLESRL